MLRWAASFTLNRLFLLAMVLVALKAYGPSTCQAGGSLAETIGHLIPGLEELNRALQ